MPTHTPSVMLPFLKISLALIVKVIVFHSCRARIGECSLPGIPNGQCVLLEYIHTEIEYKF